MLGNVKYYAIVLVTSLLICKAGAETLTKTTAVDLVIKGLDNEEWDKNEDICINEMLFVLNNVKNHTLWAAWIWDSNEFPVGTFLGSKYSLGNYDQCLQSSSIAKAPIVKTQYCLMDVKLTDGEARPRAEKPNAYGQSNEFLETTKFGRILNVIKWGVCLPASCSADSVIKISKAIYSVNPYTDDVPRMSIENCDPEGEVVYERKQMFLTIIGSLMLLATLSTSFLENKPQQSVVSKILYSFDLRRNWTSFKRVTGDEIPLLNFFKAFHAVLTTCLHGFLFVFMGAISNDRHLNRIMTGERGLYSNIVQHGDMPSIENFLVISGVLMMKSLMSNKQKPLMMLLKRYIRLIGSMAFMIFYSISALKYSADGPLWNKFINREQKACEENWIWSVLMLSNYVNKENICQIVYWYIPCDFQLAIMAVVIYSAYKMNKRIGHFVTITIAILALVLPGVVTYWKNLPGIIFYDMEKIYNMRSNVVFLESYIPSHLRAGPYLIGMAMGYILTKYSREKYSGRVPGLQRLSPLAWVTAFTVAFYVWLTADEWVFTNNAIHTAVYAAFNRNIWALMFCVLIVTTEYGGVPSIRHMMSWPGFVILSRLSYGIYVTHALVLQRYVYAQRSPRHVDMFNDTMITGSGVLMVSMLASIWLYFFVEAPLVNLTNLVLDRKPKRVENGITRVQNGIKSAQNGIESVQNSTKSVQNGINSNQKLNNHVNGMSNGIKHKEN